MNQTVGISRASHQGTKPSKEFGQADTTPQDTYSQNDIQLGTFQKGDLSFTVDFKVETDRVISGVAHFPEVDKENELILMDAISKALPSFMKHPILHLQHSERPVGLVNEAKIEDNKFIIKASIFDDDDTDDVWDDILKGKLFKFSIYGRRTVGSRECKLHPRTRTTPCVTKAIRLWSISVVSGNAINERSFFEVVKGLMETDETFIKGNDNTKTSDMEKCNTYEKSNTGIEVFPADMTSVLDRLAKIEETLTQLVESDKKVHATMEGDMEEKANDGAEQVKQPEAPIIKAEEVVETIPVVDEETIKKAILTEIDELKKAYDTKIEGILTEIKKSEDEYKKLSERITKVENETIVKGGNVVVVNSEFDTAKTPVALADRIANLEALR
jgi:hypothetical protein